MGGYVGPGGQWVERADTPAGGLYGQMAALVSKYGFAVPESALLGTPSPAGCRLFSGSVTATAGTAAGSTWAATIALPVPFTHVAPIFLNVETGAITITSCAAAAVTGYTGFPHSASTFTPILFGGAASGSMPARAAASQPTPYQGDMTPLQSVASVDGSGMYYVHLRAYFAGTGYSYHGTSTTTDNNSALFGGQTYRTTSQNVDGVSTPANFTNSAYGNNSVFVGVAYLSEVGAVAVAFVGDSTARGVNSTSGIAGPGVVAVAAMSTAALPFSVVNMGCAGATPATYEANAERYLAALDGVRIAFYRCSSINEAVSTQAIADAHFARMLRFVRFCQARGIQPIVETCTPQNLGSVSADQYRAALNARVIAWARAMGVPYVDINAAVADPAVSWQYLAAYNSGDNSHPNDAGYAVMGAAELAVLRSAAR